MKDTAPRPRRRRRAARVCLWGSCLLAALSVALALAVVAAALGGMRFSAPDWLRERIAARINSDTAGLSIGFDELSFVVDDGLVPRLALQRVVIRDAEGTPLVRLSDLRGALAFGPLLRGELRPGRITLSGARVTLRRAADGAVGLSVGETADAVEEAETVAALIGQADALLQRPHFATLTSVLADNLTLRFEDARVGKAWTVDGGRIALERDGDALRIRSDFALLGARDYATTLAISYASRIGATAADFTIDFEDMPAGDIAGQSPALAWLGALEAPISGSVRAAVDEGGGLGPLDVRLGIGAGVLRPTEGAAPVAFDRAAARFTFDPGTQLIRFDALEVESKWVTARIGGQTRLTGMQDGWPDALISQFRVGTLTLNPMGLYPEPVEIEGAALDMRLALDPFRITLGEFSLSDQGRTLVARGDVRAQPDGWYVAVDGRLPGIAPDRLMALWPQSLEPKTRTWITENVVTARLSDIEVALRSVPGRKPDVALAFDFDDLTSRFIRGMPPITSARGHASIEDNRFVIVAHQGHVTAAEGGRIDISGSSFDVPDVRIHRGPGRVRLRTDSTITAALSLLDEEPFRFLHKIGRPVTLADGRARMDGTLDFLVKDDLTPEEVAFEVGGRLTQVHSEKLLEGRVIAASELTLEADKGALEIAGKGRLGQVPFSGRFTLPLAVGGAGHAQVEGRIELSERFIEEFRIGLPPGSISGAGQGSVGIGFAPDVAPVFRLSSDLAGVGLRLAPLGWALGAQGTGRLEVSGTLGTAGTPPAIDRLVLDAAGLSAEGAVTLNPDGSLQQANFRRVRLGEWFDAPVDLVGLEADRAPLVRVTGGEIDLRKTDLGQPGGEGVQTDRGPISLRLDRLQITDQIALTDFNGELAMARGPEGNFTGLLNGQAAITGRVAPQDGRSSVLIASQDAGSVLRAAGFLKQARDGSLWLLLLPGKGAGVYEGKLNVDNLRVRDAPALAALLNALSIVGILQQLSGEGIHFNRVETRFQLAPDRVTIYEASAVGAAMGISAEGYYWPEAEVIDIEGVISPVYALNMLGGFLSRQGEGFLGFNYALKGPVAAPRVQVNPLSVFTPGMFRDIFRRPPPPRDGQDQGAGDDTVRPRQGQSGSGQDR